MTNPFTPEDRLAVAAGGSMYIAFELSCANCHGSAGLGDGPMVQYLDFAPPSFAGPWLLNAFRNHQDYTYWWLAEGVAKTPMPAWKERMSETEIWQVITYSWYLGTQSQQAPASQGHERSYPRPSFLAERSGVFEDRPPSPRWQAALSPTSHQDAAHHVNSVLQPAWRHGARSAWPGQ